MFPDIPESQLRHGLSAEPMEFSMLGEIITAKFASGAQVSIDLKKATVKCSEHGEVPCWHAVSAIKKALQKPETAEEVMKYVLGGE